MLMKKWKATRSGKVVKGGGRYGGIMREIQRAAGISSISYCNSTLFYHPWLKKKFTAFAETTDLSVHAIQLELSFRLRINSHQATKCRCSLLELLEETAGEILVCHIHTLRNPPSAFRRLKQHVSWNKSVNWGYKYIPSWTQIPNDWSWKGTHMLGKALLIFWQQKSIWFSQLKILLKKWERCDLLTSLLTHSFIDSEHDRWKMEKHLGKL